MAHSKILVVEDDASLLSALSYTLNKENYEVFTASDGEHALASFRRHQPDLVLLDIMIPLIGGLEVCRIIRGKSRVPIIMLTARTEESDKVVGLDLGADDYLTKPFGMRELLARIRALLRRGEREQDISSTYSFGELVIETGKHTVTLRGQPVELTAKEYDLLAFLARHKGLVFSREHLLERVWGYNYAGDSRTVDVHMRWLRQKLEEDSSNPRYLLTVRGAGYKLEA